MNFMEIPLCPGYSIDRHGVVYSPSGRRLFVAKDGKVTLKKDGKLRREYVGDLLISADSLRSDRYREAAERKIVRAEEAVNAKEKERREAVRRLALARRLNALLLAKIGRDQPDADLSGLRVEE